jgi:hypothetical protein
VTGILLIGGAVIVIGWNQWYSTWLYAPISWIIVAIIMTLYRKTKLSDYYLMFGILLARLIIDLVLGSFPFALPIACIISMMLKLKKLWKLSVRKPLPTTIYN